MYKNNVTVNVHITVPGADDPFVPDVTSLMMGYDRYFLPQGTTEATLTIPSLTMRHQESGPEITFEIPAEHGRFETDITYEISVGTIRIVAVIRTQSTMDPTRDDIRLETIFEGNDDHILPV